MPWYRELDNKHHAVFFDEDANFWHWRDNHRPIAPIEVWIRIRDDGHAPLNGIVMDGQAGVGLGPAGADGADGLHADFVIVDDVHIPAQDIEDAVDYNDLSIDQKLEVLIDIEGAPIEFKLALERIRQLENDADANDKWAEAAWHAGYEIGFRDGREGI